MYASPKLRFQAVIIGKEDRGASVPFPSLKLESSSNIGDPRLGDLADLGRAEIQSAFEGFLRVMSTDSAGGDLGA
jgi:hypothetical protein